MKLELTRHIFKNIQIPNVIKILPVGSELFHVAGGPDRKIARPNEVNSLFLLLGAELPLEVETFGLPNDIFPFPSILDAGYPIFNLHLANILFDIILPSILESSL